MSPKTYSTREAAKQIGVSHQTLYDWIDSGKIAAPKPIKLGKMAVRFWTEGDIAKARKVKGTLKPGPRSKKKN
jgi:excisionase family DNA binding protein